MRIPQVTVEDAKGFAEAWNRARPVAVIFDTHDIALAADFANFAVQRVFAGLLAEQAAAAKKLVLAEA